MKGRNKKIPTFLFLINYVIFKMLSRIPVFIAARGNSELKIKKNKKALKYSFVFIRSMGIINQTYIISDNAEMLEYAKKLGFKNTIYQECKDEKDIRYIEYNAIYEFHLKYNAKPDWFILLSIDELFISKESFLNCIRNIDDKYDVIASYSETTDRSIFYLDDDLTLKHHIHRITNEKKRCKMVDSRIYAIKTKFAIKCMQEGDPAEVFWHGKFKLFQNKDLYTDIYSVEDITKFSYLGHILEQVNQI